jgi:methionine synthase I (cobalamin-dependent)/5,10-methylenetetrahydrofolate reductase
MDAHGLRSLLARGPLVADGGMGTALIDAGIPVGSCVEALNDDDPALVEAVHRRFLEAGAALVLTNTFGAARFRLAGHGLAGRTRRINEAGVEVARRSGASLVGGSMGPLGVRLAPYGRVRPEDAFEAYGEQASALAAAGADLLAIETQSDLREMEQALLASREAAPNLAVLVSATFTRDDRTVLGSTPEQVAARLIELGADAIGVNCGEGPAQVLRVLTAMAPLVGNVPLAARPNAGGPAQVGGRFVYPATPAYVAELVGRFLDEGASIVGGCCGTGPAHTAAVVAAIEDRSTRPSVAVGGVRQQARPAESEPWPDPGRSDPGRSVTSTALQAALHEGRFAVAVEMEPPRSYDAATLVAAAQTLREAGADVVDVADSPMAKMRMSAWAACRLIQEGAGVETVLHFPTRGRNLLRLQGDLLGVRALGVRNLFVCVGDPVTIGDYPQALNDVDVTATGLLSLITEEFNRGRDRRGTSIGEPTAFFAGAAIAPNASDLEREVRLAHKKVAAGAAFFLSQPLYSVEPLRAMHEAYRSALGEPLTAPILAGLLPLVTARHAEFLHNEVPGIVIPESARERLRLAGDDAWRVGLGMTADLIGELKGEGVAGIYVMPQFGRYDLAAEVVEVARRS